MKTIFIALRDTKLSKDEAMAMAQLCKRICYAHALELSSSKEEADLMMAALYEIQKDLALSGFAPR